MSVLPNSSIYCPFCQIPLSLLKTRDLTLHLEVCARTQKCESLKECPKGINCDSIMICHYERFTHRMLANKRSNCKNNSFSSSIESHSILSNKNLVETHGYSSEDFKPIILKKRQKLNTSIYKRLLKHPSENSKLFSNSKLVDSSKNFHPSQIPKVKPNKDTSNKVANILNTDDNLSTETSSSTKVDEKLNRIKKKSIVSDSKRQKQADIGEMLFGLKPKVIQENIKPRKETFDSLNHFLPSKKSCPFYKKVDGTDIAVDAFSYGSIPGINYYFLSHFHYDHYMGLNKKFQAEIYCSHITGNLVKSRLKIAEERIKRLPMYKKVSIGNVSVTLLEANHCPGAVLFLIQLKNGRVILHTGDFRADELLIENVRAIGSRIDLIYLDTTYLNPIYTFPPQQDVVQLVANSVEKIVAENSRTLIVTGTYCIGKEKIFLGIARKLDIRVCVSKDKLKVLECFDDDKLASMVTTDAAETNLHVLPMNKINPSSLCDYLGRFNKNYDQLVAVKPTGWTYKGGSSNSDQLKPSYYGKVIIYAVPYSEHSSFLELKQFIELLKPNRVIPTVNIGKAETRKTMESYLNAWKK